MYHTPCATQLDEDVWSEMLVHSHFTVVLSYILRPEICSSFLLSFSFLPIIIIIIISFMQGIYTYIPETNCVPREYSVAAILLLLFVVFIMLLAVMNLLYFYISTF